MLKEVIESINNSFKKLADTSLGENKSKENFLLLTKLWLDGVFLGIFEKIENEKLMNFYQEFQALNISNTGGLRESIARFQNLLLKYGVSQEDFKKVLEDEAKKIIDTFEKKTQK
ncbi:MAG: hypothetical protein IT416_01380 [Candidatus Pacebacteria bacterium]|nr:hypothetical protein [Candidatus Paceibacterota bacterium]